MGCYKMKKLIFRICFMIKENDSYVMYKIKDYRDISTEITLKNDRTFIIAKNKPCLIHDNKRIYFVDYDNADCLNFVKVKSHLDSKSLDMLFVKKFILNLILKSDREDSKQIDWYSLIIGLIIGALVSAVIVMVLMQGKIDELYNIIDNDGSSIYPQFSHIFNIFRLIGGLI